MAVSDLHVHTSFCDGNDSPKDVVECAVEIGLKTIGLVCHSYTFFDESYCIKKGAEKDFVEEVSILKGVYGDQINVLCGVEQDALSTASTDGFDYVIGSVHYVKKGEEIFPIDESFEILESAIKRLYNGDAYLLIEDYFQLVSEVVERTGANVIGHLDLIKKFNKDGKLFDEKNERYVKAYKKAVDKLVKYGVPFEINLGGILRGYTIEPYPSNEIVDYIKLKGGSFVINSDSHSIETLLFDTTEIEKRIK